MKLTTTTMVTVDGVMQGLGAPDEDRRGGFERGGWVAPFFDDEAGTFLNQVYQRADAFLFGRRTYEIFAGSWGTWADPGDSPIWTALNAAVPRDRPGHRARPGRIQDNSGRGDDPGLPARRAPAVRHGHGLMGVYSGDVAHTLQESNGDESRRARPSYP
jgi:hypothetical protein